MKYWKCDQPCYDIEPCYVETGVSDPKPNRCGNGQFCRFVEITDKEEIHRNFIA